MEGDVNRFDRPPQTQEDNLMLKFIAPLLALIGLVGFGFDSTDTTDSGSSLTFESTASSLNGGSTAKGSVEL